MKATAMITVMLAVLVLAGCGGAGNVIRANGACPPTTCRETRMQVFDLSHPLQPGMSSWPGTSAFKMTQPADAEAGHLSHSLQLEDSAGTHLTAPARGAPSKRNIAQLPADELLTDAIVIDLRARVASDEGYLLSPNDIDDWEAAHGEVPAGCVVIINTGWHKRFADPTKYSNQDASGKPHYPSISKAAAQLLVAREVAGIGIDSFGLDQRAAGAVEVSKILFDADRYQLANLANLDLLPATGTRLIIGVLPIVGGIQAPARVLALVPLPPAETFSE